MQLGVIGKLGVAPFRMRFDMDDEDTSSISCVLVKPLQKCIANAIARVWGRISTVLAQDFISVIEDDSASFAKTLQCLNTRNNASRRDVCMLFIGDKQYICVNYAERTSFHLPAPCCLRRMAAIVRADRSAIWSPKKSGGQFFISPKRSRSSGSSTAPSFVLRQK